MNVCICIGGCSRCTGSGSESKSIIIKAGFFDGQNFQFRNLHKKIFSRFILGANV